LLSNLQCFLLTVIFLNGIVDPAIFSSFWAYYCSFTSHLHIFFTNWTFPNRNNSSKLSKPPPIFYYSLKFHWCSSLWPIRPQITTASSYSGSSSTFPCSCHTNSFPWSSTSKSNCCTWLQDWNNSTYTPFLWINVFCVIVRSQAKVTAESCLKKTILSSCLSICPRSHFTSFSKHSYAPDLSHISYSDAFPQDFYCRYSYSIDISGSSYWTTCSYFSISLFTSRRIRSFACALLLCSRNLLLGF
jgi:hypothetical protein